MTHSAMRLVKLGRFFPFAARPSATSSLMTERVSTPAVPASVPCLNECQTLRSFWEEAHPEDSSAGSDWLSHLMSADEALSQPRGLWL